MRRNTLLIGALIVTVLLPMWYVALHGEPPSEEVAIDESVTDIRPLDGFVDTPNKLSPSQVGVVVWIALFGLVGALTAVHRFMNDAVRPPDGDEATVVGVVVVTTPFHASVADTARTVELFRDNGVPVLGAAVNMAEYVCDCCGESNDLFSDATADLDAPILAELPFSRDLQRRPEPGSVPEAVADLSERVLDALDAAGEVSVPADAVDIRGVAPEERKSRVRERFTGLDAGESFVLVSDRDPTPVGDFLSRLAETPLEAFDAFEVRRATPDDWVLETVKP